jgi:serine/threonine protein kinase
VYVFIAGRLAGNTENLARRYFNQLLSGLDYCHKKGTDLVAEIAQLATRSYAMSCTQTQVSCIEI